MSHQSPDLQDRQAAVLVDYDNFYKDEPLNDAILTSRLNHMTSVVVEALPDITSINIRLYGGWLEDGVLTRRASQLQALLGRPYFPLGHPSQRRLIRGSVVLVTRLVAVPDLEWAHTYRQRLGLPRLRLAERPRPAGCADHASCPIDQIQRMSRRRTKVCHAEGCSVTNDEAFVLGEQKLVDSLICCDTLALASQSGMILLLSNDLDVLPAVAMGRAGASARILLARGPRAEGTLYGGELRALGVEFQSWDAA